MNLKQSIKLYSLLLLLTFLAVQVLLVSHTMEHGILEHTHAGEQCEQFVFSENHNADTPSFTCVNVIFTQSEISYNAEHNQFIVNVIAGLNHPRAPPFYS